MSKNKGNAFLGDVIQFDLIEDIDRFSVNVFPGELYIRLCSYIELISAP